MMDFLQNTFLTGFQIKNLLIALILFRSFNSFLYLVTNSITHSVGLPYTLANIFRLLGSIVDLTVLLILLFNYIFEWCEYAYSRTVIDIGALLFISGLHWALLIRQKERVQPVFVIGILTMLLFLVVLLTNNYMETLRLQLPALLLYLGGYNCCWLVFHFYEKQIMVFMVKAGDKLSWVDPLMGSIPHTELALKNVCSFNLGLLNLMYINTFTTGAVNIITLVLVGLSLFTNILIGLRLIKVSASVKLETSFMLQIIKHGYSNITTVYGQLKKKQLPKATWYAWVITLMMGVTLISPAYAGDTSTDGASTMGFSGSGGQPSGTGEGSGVSEGATGSRLRQGAQRVYEHTVNRLGEKAMNAPADGAVVAATAGAGYLMGQVPFSQPTANLPTELEAATERATKAEADASAARAETQQAKEELANLKDSWLYRMCPVCFLLALVMILVTTSI